MKPYTNLNGKAKFPLFWGDKISKKVKQIFKKSARQQSKKVANYELINLSE